MRAPLLLALMLVGCDGGINPPATGGGGGDTKADAAELTFGADSIDFGELGYGELAQTTLSVSNPGGTDLVLTSITTESPFTVSPPSLTLFAGTFSTITVFVQPSTYDTFADALTIVTDDDDLGTLTVPLSAETIRDADGDGHDVIAAGGDDCDDTDAAVNPDAAEVWYDNVDENCDGLNDFDQDGDGYDAETDQHHVAAGQADCNDTNPDFNPAAVDVPYDNRDSNCDGSNDFDYDGDGYESLAYSRGSDCNDYDANVNKDAIEQFDGQDNDCDGSSDNAARAEGSPYIYNADGTWDRTGYSVAIGDVTGDGIDEIFVGAPYNGAANGGSAGRGGVAEFDAPSLLATGTSIDHADNWYDGNGAADLLGINMSVIGDFDGDGTNDFAVSATGANSASGAVYILGGDDARRGDLGDAMATYTGTGSSFFGEGLGTDIDLDGDGMAELVAMYTTSSVNYVALQYGSSSPTSQSVNAMDAKWSTTGSEIAFYRNGPVGGDLDGDGYDDLVLADGKADHAGVTDSGAMWVLWGQGVQYDKVNVADIETDATPLVYGTTSSDYDAWSVQLGDDWDGDGDNELWIYNAAEALYVVEGGSAMRSSFDPASSAAVTYTWNSASSDAEMIRRAGDWDGDGISDMFVFLEDTSGHYGMSEMFGTTNRSGTYLERTDRIGSLEGDTTYENGNVGYGSAPLGGDVDGDGDADMVVGDPDWTNEAGQAYVLINSLVSE